VVEGRRIHPINLSASPVCMTVHDKMASQDVVLFRMGENQPFLVSVVTLWKTPGYRKPGGRCGKASIPFTRSTLLNSLSVKQFCVRRIGTFSSPYYAPYYLSRLSSVLQEVVSGALRSLVPVTILEGTCVLGKRNDHVMSRVLMGTRVAASNSVESFLARCARKTEHVQSTSQADWCSPL